MEKKRNAYFDNVKAFLIFLVVLGHVLSHMSGDGAVSKWIYLLIFSFHMPAFLFVSGYFSKPDPKRTVGRLILLYLVFQVLQQAINFIGYNIADPGSASFEFQLFYPMWTLWYLVAMILYGILLPLFDTDDRKKQIRNMIIAFIMGMVISCSPDTDNFLAASRVVTFLPFYLAGYYSKINGTMMTYLSERKKIFSTEGIRLKISAAAAGIFMAVLLWFSRGFWDSEWFFGTCSYLDSGLTPPIKGLCYVLAFAGIFVLLVFVPQRRLGGVTDIGKNTLGIYLFHPIVLLIIEEIPGLEQLTKRNLLLCVLIAVLITAVLSRNQVSNILRPLQLEPGRKEKKQRSEK